MIVTVVISLCLLFANGEYILRVPSEKQAFAEDLVTPEQAAQIIECTFPFFLNPNARCKREVGTTDKKYVESIEKGMQMVYWVPPTLFQAAVLVSNEKAEIPPLWADYPFGYTPEIVGSDMEKAKNFAKSDGDVYTNVFELWKAKSDKLTTMWVNANNYLSRLLEKGTLKEVAIQVLKELSKTTETYNVAFPFLRDGILLEQKAYDSNKILIWHTGAGGDQLTAMHQGMMSSISLGMSLFAGAQGDAGASSLCLFIAHEGRVMYAFQATLADFQAGGCLYTSTMPPIMDLYGLGELFHARLRYSLRGKDTFKVNGIGGPFAEGGAAVSSALTEDAIAQAWLKIRGTVEAIKEPAEFKFRESLHSDPHSILESSKHHPPSHRRSIRRLRDRV